MKNKAKRIIAVILAGFLCLEIYPLPLRDVMAQGTVGTASESDATSVSGWDYYDSNDSLTEKVYESIAGEGEDKEPASEEEALDALEETTEEAEEEEPQDVAFSAETQCDGFTIKVESDPGVFPEGSTLSASKVSDAVAEAEGVSDAVEGMLDDDTIIADAYTFDITIYDKDGNEIEPDNSKGEVRVSFDAALIEDTNFETDVYHIKDEANSGEIEKLVVSQEGSVAEVVTDGFSYYYVTFSYNTKSYKLERGVEVMLEEITATLGLSGHPILDNIGNSNVLESRVVPGYGDEPDDYFIMAKPDYDPVAGTSSTVTFHMDGSETSIYINIQVGTDADQSGEGSGIKFFVSDGLGAGNYMGAFDVNGIDRNGNSVATTYAVSGANPAGYVTKFKVGSQTLDLRTDTEGFEFGKPYFIGDVSIYITARIDESGNAVLLTYTFDNSGNDDVEASVGSAADIKIAGNDSAPIYLLSNGIKMYNPGTNDIFLLMPVDGNFTTRWRGGWSSAVTNMFTNMTDTSEYKQDSGLAWSWTVNVPAGGTVSRTAKLIAGDYTTATISFNSNTGVGTMDDLIVITNAPTTLTMNTF